MKSFVSLWSADLLDMGRGIDVVDGVADGYHIDIFDGHRADELLFGPDFVAAVRKRTKLPIDVHLMVTDPDHWVPRFIDAGADMVSVQTADSPDIVATLGSIRARGAQASLAVEVHEEVASAYARDEHVDRYLLMGTAIGIKGVDQDPRTPRRVAELRELLGDSPKEVFVDGGIRANTVGPLAAAGCHGVIPGSLVYGDADPAAAIERLHGLSRKAVR